MFTCQGLSPFSRSILSNSCDTMDCSPPGSSVHGILRPWDSPGKNTAVGSHFLLQGIFPTQESNPGLLHCRQILYQLSYEKSPELLTKETINNYK